MPSYNKVMLMGNITRDPQLKYLPSQTAVCEFGIAVNRKYKTSTGEERDEVTFVDVAAFGKTGEAINQYLAKGKPIFIEGRLKFDSWEDKNGGGKRSKLSVICDSFQFIGGRDDAPAGDRQPDDRPAPERRQQAVAPSGGGRSFSRPERPAPAEQPFGEEQQFKDDDIPFAHRLPSRWI